MKRGKLSVSKMLQFSFIMERELTDIKPVDSFFTAYEEFCREIFDDNWDILSSSYSKWIKERLKRWPVYRSFNKNDGDKVFMEKLKKDALLAVDIRDNGLKMPVTIRSCCTDDGFFHLDGAHRLVIYKVLGKVKIDFTCEKKFYDPCFTGMKKWIKNLKRNDFK